MQAASVIVRYLGGDSELVAEVWANRVAQEALAREQPEHFARVFGEAVEATTVAPVQVEAASSPPAVENWREQRLAELQIELAQAQNAHLQQEARKLHLETVEKALQVGDAQGYMANSRYQELVRKAVNARMLPPGENPDGMLDVAECLRLQGNGEMEVACLAGEFGKCCKLRKLQEHGKVAPTTTQDWGPDEKEVCLYHREKDRPCLAASYAAFKERPLFA